FAFVQRDAGPGQPLHERHWRIAVDVRFVKAVLLDDAEHAGRRRMPGSAGRDRSLGNDVRAVIDFDALAADRDDDVQRTLRRGYLLDLVGLFLFRLLRDDLLGWMLGQILLLPTGLIALLIILLIAGLIGWPIPSPRIAPPLSLGGKGGAREQQCRNH